MIHSEIMPEGQRGVLSRIGALATETGFYLARGTAIALQLGHRRSVDLDWFVDDELPDAAQFAHEIRELGLSAEPGKTEKSASHFAVSGVRNSFLRYRYQMLETFVDAPEFGCRLAGLSDLAAMKLSALTQRSLKRDFVDLYAIVESGIPLSKMMTDYKKKFNVEDDIPVLRRLAYFDDAETDEMPEMLQRIQATTLRDAITRRA